MFQNINEEENQQYNEGKKKLDIKSLFTINDIVLYAISFMVSMVSFDGNFAPFGLAIFAATCSNRIPAGIVYLIVAIRNIN